MANIFSRIRGSITNAIDNAIDETLREAAEEIAAEARANAPTARIADNIHVSDISGAEGRREIAIYVNIRESGAPEGRAYEYGSGIHSTREEMSDFQQGPGELYDIYAKNVPNLKFWWENGGKIYFGPKLTYGHPGVAPRPYLRPALEAYTPSTLNRLKADILGVVRDNIFLEFKK